MKHPSSESRTYILTIRPTYVAGVAIFAAIGVLCVGVTGIYFGSEQQAKKNIAEVHELHDTIERQQLQYEKRLGEQSARYALEAGQSVQALKQLQQVIQSIQMQNAQYAADRQQAVRRATAAAQNAASEARAARDHIAELTQQSRQTSAAAVQAASAAVQAASTTRETQRVLENATYPAAQVPGSKWGKQK